MGWSTIAYPQMSQMFADERLKAVGTTGLPHLQPYSLQPTAQQLGAGWQGDEPWGANMKTDVLFYKLFSQLPETFFLLIGQPAEEGSAYKMEALEVKQTAYRMDGIFRPDPDRPDKPIYFAEVQFQDRERFYQRFFAKVFDYFDQNVDDREWRAKLIFAERKLDPGVPVQYEKAFVKGLIERYYLEDLVGRTDLPVPLELIRLIVAPDQEAEEVARRTLQRVKEETPAGTTPFRDGRICGDDPGLQVSAIQHEGVGANV